mgnify:CR=1
MGIEMKKAHLDKICAETLKLRGEALWYPVVVAVGLMGTGAVLAIAIVKLFK